MFILCIPTSVYAQTDFAPPYFQTIQIMQWRVSVVYMLYYLFQSNTSILKNTQFVYWVKKQYTECWLWQCVKRRRPNKCAKTFITHDRIIMTQITCWWCYNFRTGGGDRKHKEERALSFETPLYTTQTLTTSGDVQC